MPLFMLSVWGDIWKCTLEKNHINATNVSMLFSHASNLKAHLKTHSGAKTNKCNRYDYACSDPSYLKEKKTFENPQWRKVKQMQPMWLCFFLGRRFEDTFENPHWRKVIQMQPMWPWFFSCKQFEGTFANPQWRKVKQMQPMWLCFFLGRGFEDTYEINTHEITQPFHTQLWINLKTHIKNELAIFLKYHLSVCVFGFSWQFGSA